MMRACMDENGMNFDEDSVEELTGALYQVKQTFILHLKGLYT